MLNHKGYATPWEMGGNRIQAKKRKGGSKSLEQEPFTDIKAPHLKG